MEPALRSALRAGWPAVSILLAAATSAQATWMRGYPLNGEKLWQDTAGPGVPRGGHRVAVSRGVYLANGKSLLIWENLYGVGQSGFRQFTPSAAMQPYPFREPAPLAAADDSNPLVLWGNWRSRDRAKTWEAMPFASDRFLVYAIGPGGVCLGGGVGETIERSLDSGRTWKPAFRGAGQGYVKHILFAESDWVFASLDPARILVSKDRGSTWADWPLPADTSLSEWRIRDIAYSSGFLWTLHVDSSTGSSRLFRHPLYSGPAARLDVGLPEDSLACLSGTANGLLIGGRQVYRIAPDGTVFPPGHAGDIALMPPGETALELHGTGGEANYSTFVLGQKAFYYHAWEAGIRNRGVSRDSRLPSRTAADRFLFPRDGETAIEARIDGRRTPGLPVP